MGCDFLVYGGLKAYPTMLIDTGAAVGADTVLLKGVSAMVRSAEMRVRLQRSLILVVDRARARLPCPVALHAKGRPDRTAEEESQPPPDPSVRSWAGPLVRACTDSSGSPSRRVPAR